MQRVPGKHRAARFRPCRRGRRPARPQCVQRRLRKRGARGGALREPPAFLLRHAAPGSPRRGQRRPGSSPRVAHPRLPCQRVESPGGAPAAPLGGAAALQARRRRWGQHAAVRAGKTPAAVAAIAAVGLAPPAAGLLGAAVVAGALRLLCQPRLAPHLEKAPGADMQRSVCWLVQDGAYQEALTQYRPTQTSAGCPACALRVLPDAAIRQEHPLHAKRRACVPPTHGEQKRRPPVASPRRQLMPGLGPGLVASQRSQRASRSGRCPCCSQWPRQRPHIGSPVTKWRRQWELAVVPQWQHTLLWLCGGGASPRCCCPCGLSCAAAAASGGSASSSTCPLEPAPSLNCSCSRGCCCCRGCGRDCRSRRCSAAEHASALRAWRLGLSSGSWPPLPSAQL